MFLGLASCFGRAGYFTGATCLLLTRVVGGDASIASAPYRSLPSDIHELLRPTCAAPPLWTYGNHTPVCHPWDTGETRDQLCIFTLSTPSFPYTADLSEQRAATSSFACEKDDNDATETQSSQVHHEISMITWPQSALIVADRLLAQVEAEAAVSSPSARRIRLAMDFERRCRCNDKNDNESRNDGYVANKNDIGADDEAGDVCTRLWRVQRLPGRGKGVVATCDIQSHELLAHNWPTLLVHAAFLARLFGDSSRTVEQLDDDLAVLRRRMLDTAVWQLRNDRQRRLVLGLSASGRSRSRLEDVLRENTFAIDVEGERYMGLFGELSPDSHIGRLQAERQAHLRAIYGFDCNCSLCRLPARQRQASDQVRRRLREIREVLFPSSPSRDDRDPVVNGIADDEETNPNNKNRNAPVRVSDLRALANRSSWRVLLRSAAAAVANSSGTSTEIECSSSNIIAKLADPERVTELEALSTELTDLLHTHVYNYSEVVGGDGDPNPGNNGKHKLITVTTVVRDTGLVSLEGYYHAMLARAAMEAGAVCAALAWADKARLSWLRWAGIGDVHVRDAESVLVDAESAGIAGICARSGNKSG